MQTTTAGKGYPGRYPIAYHRAIEHLIEYGAHGGDTRRGRRLLAAALWAMRAWDRAWARRERSHLLNIAGVFPNK